MYKGKGKSKSMKSGVATSEVGAPTRKYGKGQSRRNMTPERVTNK